MEKTVAVLDRLSPLDEEAKSDLINAFQLKAISKDSLIIKEGTVCRKFYFIRQGLIKLYSYKTDKEFIQKFFVENMVFTDPKSYLNDQPSTFNAQALENTLCYTLDKNEINTLCKKHHSIERLFSRIYQQAMLEMLDRIIEMLEENASVRYHKFIKTHHYLLQRISLGDLSGYLGITQGSLSRIRAQK